MPESTRDPVKQRADGQAQEAVESADAVPTRIDLDDFIEAVTRGVTRAMQAQDEVSGYLLIHPGPITIGLVLPRSSS